MTARPPAAAAQFELARRDLQRRLRGTAAVRGPAPAQYRRHHHHRDRGKRQRDEVVGGERGANASEAFAVPVAPGIFGGLFHNTNLQASGSNGFNGSGGASAANTFSGTLTVTVTGVLPNGNLEVSGEKQMLINQGNEFVRFSGVVNPTPSPAPTRSFPPRWRTRRSSIRRRVISMNRSRWAGSSASSSTWRPSDHETRSSLLFSTRAGVCCGSSAGSPSRTPQGPRLLPGRA